MKPKDRVTEIVKFFDEYKKASNAATGAKYDQNANVTTKNIATMQAESIKKLGIDVQRYVAHEYIKKCFGEDLAEQYIKDLEHHTIYTNDESTLGGYPYCAAISLYPFLLNGLKDLGGSSGPPKHTNGYIGGLINLIFLVAGQLAGACAAPETLVYMDHFLRLDFGQDYTDHLDDDNGALRHKIEDWFQQFVYSINQPAGSRNYQSPFTNISYYDKYYFASIFRDFVFPDGDEPCWETTKELQKMFMKWFNKERTREVLTFPVETMNLLWDPETKEYKDQEMADFTAEMWAEGHSFFLYNSDSADALSSCCFSKNQVVLARSCSRGQSKVYFDTFENIGKTCDGPDRKQFEIFHNGSWCHGHKIQLPSRPMYKITTSNNKTIIVSDNHLNPCIRGNIPTTQLTTEDYLLFNNQKLEAFPEQDLHLTYEQGFAVGAFLGDGSLGGAITLANGEKVIYDVQFSQNISKYAKCIEMVNKANSQLGDDGTCRLSEIYNNVYPVRISSRSLVDFIIHWTNWERGTKAHNKELNMECLLQSSEFRRGILDGWYNTDGGNANRCYTISSKLANCMEALITSLGMNSVITNEDRSGEEIVIREEKSAHNYPLYTVRWYDRKNKRSMKDVYKVINNSIYFKISSIEPVDYEGDIYCFEMDNPEEPYFTLPNGVITHNCRLKNKIESNVFSYTLGAGGVKTGSKRVITLNLNRIVQDWYRSGHSIPLKDYLVPIVNRLHKYLMSWNRKLWDDFEAGILTVFSAGFISLDDEYLTCGFNGFVEAAEFLGMQNDTVYNGIRVKHDNKQYQQLAKDILGTIKDLNTKDKADHCKFNTEMIPAESVGVKHYKWDKEDGYWVPESRVCYNSYFYPVEDPTYDVVEKMYLHGEDFIGCLDGGSAYHCNLEEHLTQKQYRVLMDIAAKVGCSYFTFNIPNTICNECGHINKHKLDRCPECGSTNLDYATRIVGYLKRISNFSEKRQAEAAQRYYAGETGVNRDA